MGFLFLSGGLKFHIIIVEPEDKKYIHTNHGGRGYKMKKTEIGKIFRKVSSFLLTCGMIVTSAAPGMTSYAADTSNVCTVGLTSNEHGKIFATNGTTDEDNTVSFNTDETAKIQVQPDEGYFLKNITFKSDNDKKVKPKVAGTEYSFKTEGLDKVTVKATFAADSEKRLIKSFSELEGKSATIDKGSLEEAVANCPKTVEVTLGDMTKEWIEVTWSCDDDYENTDYDVYSFVAQIDDSKYELADNLTDFDVPYFDINIMNYNIDADDPQDREWLIQQPDATTTIDQALGAKNVVAYLESHRNDNYFLGTPFGGDYLNESNCMRPNGDHGGDSPRMNCAGFVSYVFRKNGADLGKLPHWRDAQDLYCNASNWLHFANVNKVKSYNFYNVDLALKSGVLKKGDIVFFEPRTWNYGEDCHIGFFWGENSSDNKFWSSTNHSNTTYAGTNPGNQISDLVAKTSDCYVYVFPVQHVSYGKLRLHKWSSDASLTNGNSNYSLEGAEYTIYSNSDCTQFVQTLKVGSDGYTDVSKDLTPGTYWVKETKAANKGYQIDTKAHSVQVVAGTTADSPSWLDVFEAPKTTKILLTKSSAVTEITQDNPNYDLSGAVYRVYTDKACTKWTGKSITTDKNGNGKLENLALNEYWIKEYSNPQGYQLDQAVYHVDGRDQWGVNIISVNLTVEENPFTPEQFESTIAIQKVDSETGKPVAVDNGSLANAQFEVKYYRKQMDTNPADSGETPRRTWILKTDENGQIYFKDSYKVSGDDFYHTKDGKVTIPLGTITYEEIKSPNGYLVNSEVITVKIKQDSDNKAAPVYVTPTQKEKALTLTLVKTQAGTDKVIEGAVFEHTLPDGTTEQFTTDADGKIEFQGLQWGNHTIKEISVPDGYSVNKNPITFTVAEDNTVTITSQATETDTNGNIKLTVEDDGNISAALDEKLAPFDLHIHKINNHDKVLEGAEFTVYSDADCKTEVTKGKTNDKGDLTFEDLIPERDYYLKETKAPQGYRIPINADGSDIVYKVRVESVPVDGTFNFFVNDKAYTVDSKGQFTVTGTKADRIVNMIITNDTTQKLPNTGSNTMLIIMIAGMALAVAGIAGVTKKKKDL